jgi:mono/diheme cytochrome c family protein
MNHMLIMKNENIYSMKNTRFLALIVLFLIVLASCNRNKNNPGYAYMGENDMYYTKFYKAYSPNPIFSDSMTNQLPVDGAVSRGNMPFPYATASITDRAVNQTLAGKQLENPIIYNDETVAIGKNLYNIYCKVCHGETAAGDGNLYTSGLFPAKPTSLVDTYVQAKPDGEIYYVITAGSISGLMGPHGAQVTPDERWMIINYLRSLAK